MRPSLHSRNTFLAEESEDGDNTEGEGGNGQAERCGSEKQFPSSCLLEL